MTTTAIWDSKRFPMIYDSGKPTAVIVDLSSFEQIEIVMENLFNRGPEPEDEIIVQSEFMRKIAEKVLATAQPLDDWEKALDEL